MELQFRSVAASSFAEDVDKLFFVLLALTLFFSIVVGGLLAYLAVRYRRGSNVDRSNPIGHHDILEAAWSGGPLIIALVIFFWAAKLYTNVYAAPANTKEVFVIGKQWMWHLQHANGIRENNELHLAVNEPVKLVMISQDVIHAFYVPEFRVQRQVEPGSYDSMWFTPTKTGRFHMYCNMYCGTQHSEMGGWVYVMSRSDYQRWLATGNAHPAVTGGLNTPQGGLTMAQQGAALFEQYQCASCHNAEAVSRGRGPSLKGIYGKNRQLDGNRVVKADFGYLRNTMLYPNEYALAGWPQGMPSYKGVVTEEQILLLNEYIRSLSGKESQGGVASVAPNVAAADSTGAPAAAAGSDSYAGAHPGRYGPQDGSGGIPNTDAPAANTDNQQWRYMYGGEQYQ
jgi:cytochrome c oxidase subunit 2